MGFALKSSTWEVQGTGCSAALTLLPAPRGGDRGTSVCPQPTGGAQRRPPLPQHILVIQMRSSHKGEGPALNKEPLGTARGTRSMASTDECKCLHPLGATPPVTTQTGIVSGRHRSYASPQECPASPSWGNAWGAQANLPWHPQPCSREEEAHTQLPCTHALTPKLKLLWRSHVPCHPQGPHPCRLIS